MTRFNLATMILSMACATQATAATVLYSETFDGIGASPINGVPSATGVLQTGSVAWSANAILNTDGSVVNNDGSAILPFTPVVDAVYTVSADFSANNTTFWSGIGFLAEVGGLQSPGVNRPQDRFAQLDGVAWMLARSGATTAEDVQLFAGPNTSVGIADNDADFSLDTTTHTLAVVIDTTGDGSSFTAEFFVNGSSISFGPQTVNIPIAEITHVGLTNDSPTPSANNNTSTELTGRSIDNFLLTGVPEPSSAALLSVGVLAWRRRRQS